MEDKGGGDEDSDDDGCGGDEDDADVEELIFCCLRGFDYGRTE